MVPKDKKMFLYILTNISMPNICKIGITNNISKQLQVLNEINLPTKFQIYEKFELDKYLAEELEQEILREFSEYRINKRKKFLQVHPERICDFVNINKNIRKNKKIVKNKRFKNFAELNIKKGEVLKFQESKNIYNSIRAKVVSEFNNKVMYGNEEFTLSKLAKNILKDIFNIKWKSVQGTVFWTYKGKTIRDLLDELENN